MLCPDCNHSAPGGSTCPACGNPIPERETFAGQGGRYLLVLFGFSCLLLLLFVLADHLGFLTASFRRLYTSGWVWLYILVIAMPTLVGLYYWALLREEEVTVTDEYIDRRSHWGNQRLAWADVRRFAHHTLPLRQTRLGRVTWFSRFFPKDRGAAPSVRWPGSSYELIGPPDEAGNPSVMRLEPGTIDDMSWLLRLIEEHVGPPVED